VSHEHHHRYGRDHVQVLVDRQVAAFRARWTFDGRTEEWIEAAYPDRSGSSVFMLGRKRCRGSNVPPFEFHRGGTLELYAIDFDGTETRVEGLPDEIRTDPHPLLLPLALAMLAILCVSLRVVPPARTWSSP
jgi:hypothetical protein